jgi:hypothetical protein
MRVVTSQSKGIGSHICNKKRFKGKALIRDLVAGQFEKDINVNRVSFRPGALTHCTGIQVAKFSALYQALDGSGRRAKI